MQAWSTSAGRSSWANRSFRVGAAFAGLLLTAGCGTPPELRRPGGKLPSPTVTVTSPGRTGPPSTGVTTPGGASSSPIPTTVGTDPVAVPCAGRPTGRQVVELLRRTGSLPQRAQVTVTGEPVCADDWQYSVVQVPNREPLQVISNGRPEDLMLVTVGTDVCDARIRALAPTGIRMLACEGGAVLPPPA